MTNAQIALEAASRLYSGTRANSDSILAAADNFLRWLNDKDEDDARHHSDPVEECRPIGVSLKDLDPADKVRMIEEMGFSRRGDDHHVDCLTRLDNGFVCICVPEPDHYSPPQDVVAHWGQTWEQRSKR